MSILSDVKEALTFVELDTRLKHLPGQHDQASHGSWASGTFRNVTQYIDPDEARRARAYNPSGQSLTDMFASQEDEDDWVWSEDEGDWVWTGEDETPTLDKPSDWNKAAIEEFGLTYDLAEAGYVLTNGDMLDFSGKREGGSPGVRSYDHRQIGVAFEDYDIETLGGTDGMMYFMQESGAIRISYYGDDVTIDIAAYPTTKQFDWLKEIDEQYPIIWDVTDPATGYRLDSGEGFRDLRSAISDAYNDPKTGFKHLPGQHEQISHGNWADRLSYYRDQRQEMSDQEWSEFKRIEREWMRGQSSMFTKEEWEALNEASDDKPLPRVGESTSPRVEFDVEDTCSLRIALDEHNINLDDIQAVVDLNIDGLVSQTEVSADNSYDDDIRVKSEIVDSGGNSVGNIEFNITSYSIRFGYFKLDNQYGRSGNAVEIINDMVSLGQRAGIDRISLEADISIGKYAWAKLGFDYDGSDYSPEQASEVFQNWFSDMSYLHGLDEPPDGWPEFESAMHVAEYDPGIYVKGSNISNRDVPKDMTLPLGKAFMLDDRGHGKWHGELYVWN